MKFLTTEQIRRSIDDEVYADALEELFSNEDPGPCRHVSVRVKEDSITLYLDEKEILKQRLSKLGYTENPPKSFFDKILNSWREDNMNEVRKILCLTV